MSEPAVGAVGRDGSGVAAAEGRAETGAPSPRRGARRSALRWTTGAGADEGSAAGVAAERGAAAAGADDGDDSAAE
ncbi:hypothetical protein [Streptomyces similanensis]|uniref:hypothetical protein n=1 Tax=Streptomyces similanensis TaxID=1274988 RepID=UPI0031EDA8DC